MYSSPIPPPQSASASAAATSVAPPPPSERSKEMVYRTKVIQFLGRKAPIILQNDNGPCPLLAICNVLSLKNSLNLSPDFSEVSQEKLLSLVAERLIDSNTNINNKDTVYVENQQQNIADAIDLLPRLTTGIDVNIKFKRIDDFEFTPECAIFDLLDIPLYHGWIVDPQDLETADAIGFNSYNTLMGELVSLETKTMESDQKKNPEDDSVDFVAATTASLGVPSPSLSRSQSFQESPRATRKGDIEEEIELVKALNVSETEKTSFIESVVNDVNVHDSAFDKKSEVVTDSEDVEKKDTVEPVICLIADDCSTLKDHDINLNSAAVVSQIIIGQGSRHTQTVCDDSREHGHIVVGSDAGIDNEKLHHVSSGQNPPAFDNSQDESREHGDIVCEDSREHGDIVVGSDAGIENEKLHHVSSGQNPPAFDNSQDESRSDEYALNESTTTSDKDEPRNHQNACEQNDMFNLLKGDEHGASDSDVTSGLMQHVHEQKSFSSSIDSTEPIYEGEERILDSGSVAYDNQEPVYEGEVVLAEQVERGSTDVGGLNSKEISVKQGEIIRNFMKNSASQITVYGLFCLQDKVKERELCVFFRNNHFNTMFKYEGELYILATDQGFINQPDLVWEKLNEVNGDTEYMTCNFKEFKMDDHSNSTWDEQNVMTSTADYLASIDNAEENSSFNSDLQLAIALQQQEFDQQQQPQQQQPQQEQQPASSGNSRMVTGPQVPRGKDKYPSSSKQESKSKEKCIIM